MRSIIIYCFLVIFINVFGCKTYNNKNASKNAKTEPIGLNLVKGYFDNNISENIKSEINILNEKLFKAVKENNLQNVKALISPKLLETSGAKLDSLVLMISDNLSESNSYSIKNELYIINSSSNVPNNIFSGLKNDYDFSVNYQALNKEMYISLIIPDTEPDQMLITCIYGKYENDWKINILQFGLYSLNKKNAVDLYKQAQEQYKKGYLMDVAFTGFLAQQCLKPANQYFKYQLESKIINFFDSIYTVIPQKYVFPTELSSIQTKPTIFNISPQSIDEGIFPSVEYLTKIPMNDTINLKKENDEIHNIIGNIYQGIDKEKKYLFYKAWSKIPDGKTKIETYGFYKILN